MCHVESPRIVPRSRAIRNNASRLVPITGYAEVIPADPIRTMTFPFYGVYQNYQISAKMGWRVNPPGLKGVDDKQQIEARGESTSRA